MRSERSRDICQPQSTSCHAHVAAGSAALQWFLVLTKPCAEKVAELNLERQGYRVYYPRLLRPSLSRGRWKDRIVSLFPRYLFIQLDATCQSLAPVRSTVGVASIVCFGARTAVVSDAIIAALMHKADPQSGLHELQCPLFEVGSAVRVLTGAFAGLEGIFERQDGQDRVVILFQMLGREARVNLPAGFVAPERAA